jgi:hypothetical protein
VNVKAPVPKRVWVGVGGVVALLALALVLQAVFGVFGRWPRSRQKFEAAVTGQTPEGVRGVLGDPDGVSGEGSGWYYRKATYDPATGKTDPAAWVWFADGRVIHVTYDPPPGGGSRRLVGPEERRHVNQLQREFGRVPEGPHGLVINGVRPREPQGRAVPQYHPV